RASEAKSPMTARCGCLSILPGSGSRRIIGPVLIRLLPNHRSTKETEDLIDRIGNGAGAAPGVQQAHGAWIGRDVLDHERAGVAAVQELAAAVCDHNLTRKGLDESRGAGARALVLHGHSSV